VPETKKTPHDYRQAYLHIKQYLGNFSFYTAFDNGRQKLS